MQENVDACSYVRTSHSERNSNAEALRLALCHRGMGEIKFLFLFWDKAAAAIRSSQTCMIPEREELRRGEAGPSHHLKHLQHV